MKKNSFFIAIVVIGVILALIGAQSPIFARKGYSSKEDAAKAAEMGVYRTCIKAMEKTVDGFKDPFVVSQFAKVGETFEVFKNHFGESSTGFRNLCGIYGPDTLSLRQYGYRIEWDDDQFHYSAVDFNVDGLWDYVSASQSGGRIDFWTSTTVPDDAIDSIRDGNTTISIIRSDPAVKVVNLCDQPQRTTGLGSLAKIATQ